MARAADARVRRLIGPGPSPFCTCPIPLLDSDVDADGDDELCWRCNRPLPDPDDDPEDAE